MQASSASSPDVADRGNSADSGGEAPWHTRSVPDTEAAFDVDASVGLDESTVAERQREFGPNELGEGAKDPAWKKIARLLADKMTIVLVVAAAVSAFVSREWETPVVILVVITFNTVLNYVQEARAESSLEALRESSVAQTRVRRGGHESQVPPAELVPGDVVRLEAGDAVPADGRLVEAVRLQVAEASLTGESQPVDKTTETFDDPKLPIGDRANMLFMNTAVTRGTATMVVTATGMSTQMGAIAGLLGEAGGGKTPLQRRIDHLAGVLTVVAIAVVAVVFVMGLLRGQSWSELLLTAVSLAVATIPEGLTAVVAFTLAMGASKLARRGAIIKQLAAVETLGSTAHIATDKTGTLTLNEMTVRRLLIDGRAFKVSGEGYSTDGKILTPDRRPLPDLTDALLSMALCNDASINDGQLVGDPTEGALVVLAEKGGIDVEGARKSHPRVAQVPFDSDYKFMATFHRADDGGPESHRCFVKGAPGVLLELADSVLSDDGPRRLESADRERIGERIDELAAEGLRTLLIAGRDIDGDLPDDPDELKACVTGLTVYAVVGIVDPARPEAAKAIQVAREAGIVVHMITGDHLVTASAIADSLGIPGDSAEGSGLDDLDDDALRDRARDYGVLARVAPEHKIRFVKALQARGEVIAMTGDGVNDAPALKQADIGVAMGITGTDVSKGAAKMILTDDNFATIVAAVQEGRGIYANIVKFVRFQLTTAWGFVLIFLVAGALGLAGGSPFTALQILWVNIIMDGPPAMALGVDPPETGTMTAKPRPPHERLLNRQRLVRILLLGLVMTVGTVAVLAFADDLFPESAGDPLFVTTLAFTTFVFYQVFNLLNVRSVKHSVFSLQTFTNRSIWVALGAVIVLQIMVVNLGVLQDFFDTTSLTSAQWGLAILVGSSVLWVEEIVKAILRARDSSGTESEHQDGSATHIESELSKR
ncbi:calcium-translocating P-type ATPase, PMCA-type [Mycobacterium sp. IDR2000157661]|uniref:calcium-translocating P-type ATPase, PMCA-type n=1 Tax=Mycobacterium sp. IDR2000157661 TaxID=2867005 RepID=UPI001EEB117B|nr:calcium-translocating P-type ATPase, PMCA-type [Mycobacterium sp. IDR2000157661]ULE32268.1 calcium-translocating P-type ATPase, PMCA-type [Mycobacterium sp. IDR2000157661]